MIQFMFIGTQPNAKAPSGMELSPSLLVPAHRSNITDRGWAIVLKITVTPLGITFKRSLTLQPIRKVSPSRGLWEKSRDRKHFHSYLLDFLMCRFNLKENWIFQVKMRARGILCHYLVITDIFFLFLFTREFTLISLSLHSCLHPKNKITRASYS